MNLFMSICKKAVLSGRLFFVDYTANWANKWVVSPRLAIFPSEKNYLQM